MTEKWIQEFGFAIDAYSDIRRTGYPQYVTRHRISMNTLFRPIHTRSPCITAAMISRTTKTHAASEIPSWKSVLGCQLIIQLKKNKIMNKLTYILLCCSALTSNDQLPG
jgi:hypothetical protein